MLLPEKQIKINKEKLERYQEIEWNNRIWTKYFTESLWEQIKIKVENKVQNSLLILV